MGLFDDIGGAIGSAAKGVASVTVGAAKGVATAVTHPAQLPGLALNSALLPVHSIAQLGGAVLKATGVQPLQAVGTVVQGADSAAFKSSLNHPLESTAVIAGAALAATGIGTVAGVGILTKGLGGIAVGAVPPPAAPPPPTGASLSGSAAAAPATVSTGAPYAHHGVGYWWHRLVLWIEGKA